MSEVIDLNEVKESNEPHYNWFAMCLLCTKRWIATAHYKTNIFSLECPDCHHHNSFASIIPVDYPKNFSEEK